MNFSSKPDYNEKLFDGLKRMGNIYTMADLIERFNSGAMQCHVSGNSFAVTEINDFPRRTALDILLAVGDLADSLIVHDKIIEFAKQNEVTLLRAQARPGWWKYAKPLGWNPVNVVYYKEL